MINEGSDSSICSCNSLVELNIDSNLPRIGEIARPGKEVTMDIE